VEITIQELLRDGLEAYRKRRRLLPYQHRALKALRRCRTAALGGHAEVCPEGHVAGVWYNSCRHRACPQCSLGQVERWLEAKRQVLLPTEHYQVVFTLPGAFRVLWRYNRRKINDLLFQVSRDSLMDLLADPQWLGARPGLVLALHTWSRTLAAHPHIHCLVTAGGVTSNGDWKPLPRNFLVPLGALRKVYRGKMLQGLEKLLRTGQLRLPPDWTLARALVLLIHESRKKWNVRIEPPYRHGEGLAIYLARYLKGGPIKNSRLLSFDDQQVTFRYRERDETRSWRTLSLDRDEFLDRLLTHLPEPGARVVRSCGLYHHAWREALERCRQQIRQAPPGPSSSTPIEAQAETHVGPPAPTTPKPCSTCGQPLGRRLLPFGGIPPPQRAWLEVGS
jgi:hypothetical protein